MTGLPTPGPAWNPTPGQLLACGSSSMGAAAGAVRSITRIEKNLMDLLLIPGVYL